MRPHLLRAMDDALQQGNMAVLERSAHSLKGAVSNLSAKATAAAALQLEQDAKNKATRLPRRKSRRSQAGRTTSAAGACRTLPGSFEVRILIADDEPVSRRMLQSLLGKWGYEVETAEDGDAAWEKLKSPDAPRLALLDWMMPGRNGVEVCRILRSQRPEPYTYCCC